jgi:uncharacterized membrane protein HdeD (DUF308 family)
MNRALDLVSRSWWAFVLRGVAAIAFGTLFLTAPRASLAALVLYFGVYAVIDGALSLSSGVFARFRRDRWGYLVVSGVLGVVAGFAALAWPAITALTLFYLIAFWALCTGVLQMVTAIRFRRMLPHEWTLGVAGALSVALGILMIARPGLGLVALSGVIAAYAWTFGVLDLLIGYEVHSLARHRARWREEAHA